MSKLVKVQLNVHEEGREEYYTYEVTITHNNIKVIEEVLLRALRDVDRYLKKGKIER